MSRIPFWLPVFWLSTTVHAADPAVNANLPDAYRTRYQPHKAHAIKMHGGSDETEEAVQLSLGWLAKQQNANGYWEFDGKHKNDRIAATGLCLLPFLAAGEIEIGDQKPKYKDTVARGLAYLRSHLQQNGQFGKSGMYSQPIATMALCESAGMTQDRNLLAAAKAAVEFILKAQAGNGSWGYTAGTEGDTSIVGWNIQALRSARLAGIKIPDNTMKKAEEFLSSVSGDAGATYGYRQVGASHTLSAVGLLCRQYMGWSPRHVTLARGIGILTSKYAPLQNDWNTYYYYYATQAIFFAGGKEWIEKWNPAMRKLTLELQITAKTANAKPEDVGSWPKDIHFIGAECGKVGTTAMAMLTLQVYYRHMPPFKREQEAKESTKEPKK